MSRDIVPALVSLYQDKKWSTRGVGYGGLSWQDASTPKPSEQELLTEMDRLEAYEGTPDDRIDKAFTPTDKDKVIFEALFELTNRVVALEGGNPVTRAQLRNWLKAKLPQ